MKVVHEVKPSVFVCPFTSETPRNYTRLDGLVAVVCYRHGRDLLRGEHHAIVLFIAVAAVVSVENLGSPFGPEIVFEKLMGTNPLFVRSSKNRLFHRSHCVSVAVTNQHLPPTVRFPAKRTRRENLDEKMTSSGSVRMQLPSHSILVTPKRGRAPVAAIALRKRIIDLQSFPLTPLAPAHG